MGGIGWIVMAVAHATSPVADAVIGIALPSVDVGAQHVVASCVLRVAAEADVAVSPCEGELAVVADGTAMALPILRAVEERAGVQLVVRPSSDPHQLGVVPLKTAPVIDNALGVTISGTTFRATTDQVWAGDVSELDDVLAPALTQRDQATHHTTPLVLRCDPHVSVATLAHVLATYSDRPIYIRGDRTIDGVFSSSALDARLTGGIGGLLGAQGTQIGVGGLGSRGSGLGASGAQTVVRTTDEAGEGQAVDGLGSLGRSAGDPIILGPLDPASIDEVITGHMNEIESCHQRALDHNPTLAGKIVIRFTIETDGSVSKASTRSTTMNNSDVEQCVVGQFFRMQFPEPVGGGIVIVSYPFTFSSGAP